MLAVFCPIYINQDEFWTSSQFLEEIRVFLTHILDHEMLSQAFVFTNNEDVKRLAENLGYVCVLNNKPVPANDISSLVQTLCEVCPDNVEGIVFRNFKDIFLQSEEIGSIIRRFENSSEEQVFVGVTEYRDYPCQLKSYYQDANLQLIDVGLIENSSEGYVKQILFDDVECSMRKKTDRIEFSLTHQKKTPRKETIIQIIPIINNSIRYEELVEAKIFSNNESTLEITIGASDVDALMIIELKGLVNGDYSVMETFTPANGTWKLGAGGDTIIDKESNAQISGRQYFPKFYQFNGSVAILRKTKEGDFASVNTLVVPHIINDSMIIQDQIDYFIAESRFQKG